MYYLLYYTGMFDIRDRSRKMPGGSIIVEGGEGGGGGVDSSLLTGGGGGGKGRSRLQPVDREGISLP